MVEEIVKYVVFIVCLCVETEETAGSR